MNLRTTKLMLWSLAGFLALVVVFSLAAGVLLPYPLPEVGPPPATQPSGGDSTASRIPPLRSFEPLWALDLRQPLFDGAGPSGPARPAFAAKLVGTIVDGASARAIFQLPGAAGGMEFKNVGDKVGGGEVLEITADSATVNYFGEKLKLKIEQQGGTG